MQSILLRASDNSPASRRRLKIMVTRLRDIEIDRYVSEQVIKAAAPCMVGVQIIKFCDIQFIDRRCFMAAIKSHSDLCACIA